MEEWKRSIYHSIGVLKMTATHLIKLIMNDKHFNRITLCNTVKLVFSTNANF